MKESKFIEQNKKNWLEFETDLRFKQNKATRLSRLFIQVTDDLSFVRTFYKNRSVKIYLNGIAQSLFNDLYRNQSGTMRGFVKFWKWDLPMLIHEARIEFRISFIIFMLAMAIGVVSSIYDKDFARSILGDDYVKMTLENISKNDPMAVYKKDPGTSTFLWIMQNNLSVSLVTFLFGIFLSIGSIYRLIYNGVMVGVFQYFFIERGIYKESLLTIWQHGTLEISAIIIAGAAGITLGKGFIFPGTYSRIESFKLSALRGLKIFLGIVPVIVLAAFIEGFFTRHTNLHIAVRLSVIVISLAFILFYFVWYPWYLARHNPTYQYIKEKPSYRENMKFDFSRILSAEAIMGYTFQFFRKKLLWIFTLIGILAMVHALAAVTKEWLQDSYDVFGTVSNFFSFFVSETASLHFMMSAFTLTLLQVIVCLQQYKFIYGSDTAKTGAVKIANLAFSSLLASAIIIAPFYMGIAWGIISMVLLSPVVFLSVYQSFDDNRFIFAALPRTFTIMQKSWGKLYWNSLKLFLLLGIFFILFNSPLTKNYLMSIYSGLNDDFKVKYFIDLFLSTIMVISLFSAYFIFQVSTSVYSFYAFKETVYAGNLKKRIAAFGERNVMFGFEKEGA